MADPLKQFVVTPIVPIEVGGIDLSLTNSAAWMLAAIAVSVVSFTAMMRRKALIPGRGQVIAEMLYGFTASMIKDNIGKKGQEYFPFIFTMFMTVLLGNMLGMLPFSFTYTSQIIVTITLALMIFAVVFIMGFAKHGLGFLGIFMPSGVPVWLTPIILPLEIVSFAARPLTLSVRLFANMMAGHLILKVFAGFSVAMAGLGIGGILFGIVPALFNTVMIGFEFMIAGLQAYVFAILTCIYLKDTVDLHH